MICIYHSRDLDGFTSAAIVKKKYPHAELIGYDYGQPIPWDKIPSGQKVIIVDVSLPMQDMERLASHSVWQLTWIDHHISAIKEYEAYVKDKVNFMEVFLKNGIAACELAWQYLFPTEEMPEAVKLLGEYDTWRKEDAVRWDNEILPFQFGMRSICNTPDQIPEWVIESNYPYKQKVKIDEIIDNGNAILRYQAQVNESLCRRTAFETNFKGYRAICLNACGINSDAFKSVYDAEKHDIMMSFFFNGDQWIFSLYTIKPDIDCSAIAKSMGGGGHRGAAGFQIDKLEEVLGIPE